MPELEPRDTYDHIDPGVIAPAIEELLTIALTNRLNLRLEWTELDPHATGYPDERVNAFIDGAALHDLEELLAWTENGRGRDIRTRLDAAGIVATYYWIVR